MKKKILGMLAVVFLFSAISIVANAETTPTIIVDERELDFADQGPVIVEETGRTLIPIRFVLNSVGAKVFWDQETKTVLVVSSDNRNKVEVTVGSDEMKMYYYPSAIESVSDVVKLDQAPVLMNDRTMIPVRAVLEAIGSIVDWDEETSTINVTSRAYARYLRDMGVEGYEVIYPLAEGEVDFDPKKEWTGEEPYDPKKNLPTISLSTDAKEVKKGETFDVYVNMANVDKLGEGAFLSTMTLTFKFDKEKVAYKGYTFVNGEEEYKPVMDAVNTSFRDDAVKLVSIATLGMEETPAATDGPIAKFTFTSKTDDMAEITFSTKSHSEIGMDVELGYTVGENLITIDDVNELCIDTTPVVINEK